MQFFFNSATAYEGLGYLVLRIHKLLGLFRIRVLHPAVGIHNLQYRKDSTTKKQNKSLLRLQLLMKTCIVQKEII